MRQLHLIQVCEDLPRFIWETSVQLYSARKYGLSDKFRVIVFLPSYRDIYGFSKEWKTLEEKFPETKFFYHIDPDSKVTDLMVNYNYIPIHRLCALEKHFKEFPELKNDAIFYTDSDVIFTSQPPFEAYIDDDNNYLSDTHTYLNQAYLSSKINDVEEGKKEEYEKFNVIDKIAKGCGVTEEILKQNNDNCGGAQYLLKNIDSQFFTECIDNALKIRIYFQGINQAFFPGETPQEREDKGIQSWCADMWAIQWNLYKHKLPCSTPKWMDFAWATEKIEKLEDVWMLHNSGVTADSCIRVTDNLSSVKDEQGNPIFIEAPAFFKETYKVRYPFNDMPSLEKILTNETSKQYCTSRYVQEIIEAYNNIIKPKENE